MNTKKKLILLVSSFSMILVAVVVTFVAVLAAPKVTVENTINISYTVTDVITDVATSTAQVASNESLTSIAWDTKKTSNLNGFENDNYSDSYDLGSYILKDVYDVLVLRFKFENKSSNPYTTSLTPIDTTNKNINVNYAFSNSDFSVLDGNGIFSYINGDSSALNECYIGAHETFYAYILIGIKDIAQNVNITNLSLNWTLTGKNVIS